MSKTYGKNGDEIMTDFLNSNKFYHFEGDQGVSRLERICETIGYRDTGLKFGTPIEHFLSDNPGCQQAIVDWISEHMTDEWADGLAYETEVEEDEEDENG